MKLEARIAEGKKLAKLRDDGFIPSVVYGGHDQPIMTQSKQVETSKVVHTAGRHNPINLTIDGKKKLVIIKSIDMDPVKHTLRHVAFHTIKQSDVITTEVPIILVGQGESMAERAGLVILQAIEHIEIKAKPADLPESLELSIINLATAEDKISISDIKLPEGVEFADAEQDMELVIANVYEPSALQAANEAAGGEAEAEEESEVTVEGEEVADDANQSESDKPETDKKPE
ncbi:MAG TPA: 50S ribosomal protein L25 [Candidatus Saccharimonadales bacterium]|nr:50S ribosomal protein L25 [Candidatus Saccharimonadales bacterium]